MFSKNLIVENCGVVCLSVKKRDFFKFPIKTVAFLNIYSIGYSYRAIQVYLTIHAAGIYRRFDSMCVGIDFNFLIYFDSSISLRKHFQSPSQMKIKLRNFFLRLLIFLNNLFLIFISGLHSSKTVC